MNNNNTLDVLKFKYGEYLIGNFKDYNGIIYYIKNNFDLKDISNNREEILSIDRFGFIRQDFYTSYINQNLKIPKNDLNIFYYILKKDDFSINYFNLEQLDFIYIAICKELNLFSSNSKLIEHELSIYQGVSKDDIENNTPRLEVYLKNIDNIELTNQIKEINPEFITPEEQKNMLEEYILDQLENLIYKNI